jgi:hypothetical protein
MASNGPRNIDFEALKALRDRHGAVYPRGRVLFREGDTQAEFFVVLAGSVELSLTDRDTGAKKVLFISPVGDFFGEMSCFAGAPRSATATVIEDNTVLLQFNQDTAIQLLRASPRFALGVIQRLSDRVLSANDKIKELTGQLASIAGTAAVAATNAPPPQGAPATTTAASGAKPSASTPAATGRAAAPTPAAAIREVPPPAYNRTVMWGKQVTCPVSNTRFVALNVRPEAVKVERRDSDFHEVCSGTNPLWYLVYVCPDCLFAAYPDDFAAVTPDEVARLSQSTPLRQRLAAGLDVSGERTLENAHIVFRLAVDSYGMRAPNFQRMGGLYHRLAWLARESGDGPNEQRYLAEALSQYLAGQEQAKSADPTTELMLLYTIGDLYLRLGKPVDSVKWLSQASQHVEFRKQPEIQRLTRERWGDARATARGRA